MVYGLGIERKKNAAMALHWVTRAAKDGVPEAQLLLGLHIMEAADHRPYRQDDYFRWWFDATEAERERESQRRATWYEGIEWLEKAAEQEQPLALSMLGHLARYPEEAFGLWQRAAVEGCAAASYALALLYVEGTGVEHDDVRAGQHFEDAATRGHIKSQVELALGYWIGRGVPKDLVLAYAWSNLAAAAADPKALELRDLVEGLMSPNQIAEAQSFARVLRSRMKPDPCTHLLPAEALRAAGAPVSDEGAHQEGLPAEDG